MFKKALDENNVIETTRKMIVMDKDALDVTVAKNNSTIGLMNIPLPSASCPPAERCENFLRDLVDNLGTELPTPEVIVVN